MFEWLLTLPKQENKEDVSVVTSSLLKNVGKNLSKDITEGLQKQD